jgi:pimeloyl-ACP methyl ester carboxylesterase
MSLRRLSCALALTLLIAAPAAAVTEAEALAIARKVLDGVAAKDYEAVHALLNNEVKALLPASRLAESISGAEAQLGDYAEMGTEPQTLEVEGSWRILHVVKLGDTPLGSLVVVDADGGVAGLQLMPLAAAAEAMKPPSPGGEAAEEETPAPFPEREVTIGAGGGALPGTLTLPEGEGPFPAVVLVHGSGPNDRDETLGPNKPFRDLAWGLADHGVATLRYEKRTRAHALAMTDIRDELTVKEEVVDDAVAAIRLLSAQPEIDARRVNVVGHSLGAYLVPRIAGRAPGLAGAVMLAAPARPMEDLIEQQYGYIFRTDGVIDETEQAQLDAVLAQVARVRSPDLSADTPAAELPLGLNANYWLDLKSYDPVALANALPLRLLVLQGERDYQVTFDEDFRAWKRGTRGRRAPTQLRSYPSLNHLFMAGEGPSTPVEYQLEGRLALEVIVDVAAWVKAGSPRW